MSSDNEQGDESVISNYKYYISGDEYMMMAAIRQPKRYNWLPKEDIATFELAQCMIVLLMMTNSNLYYGDLFEMQINGLPENCKRHFEEIIEEKSVE